MISIAVFETKQHLEKWYATMYRLCCLFFKHEGIALLIKNFQEIKKCIVFILKS